MKYIVCPDSFKGSLSSREVAEAIAKGITSVDPDADIIIYETADGGEGTAEILSRCFRGEKVGVRALNPLGAPMVTHYYDCRIKDEPFALLDVASADGLTLINPECRNAMMASSYGVGMIIREAYNSGFRNFIIGLGGSASTDCGLGILEALGFRLCGFHGEILPGNGATMEMLAQIGGNETYRTEYQDCRFILLVDVDNTLFGKNGAAYIYALQKGASPFEVKELDRGLRNVADVIFRKTGRSISKIPGGGAAGGIGGMFAGMFEAEIVSGIDFLLDNTDFMTLLPETDIVITGEGRIDLQTLSGKVPAGVLKRSLKAGKSVIAICGAVDHNDLEWVEAAGFRKVIEITPRDMPIMRAMQPDIAKENIISAVAGCIRELADSRILES